MQDLLPYITVVKDDPFNSDPNDPNLMGPDARIRFLQGEKLPVSEIKTPLVRNIEAETKEAAIMGSPGGACPSLRDG